MKKLWFFFLLFPALAFAQPRIEVKEASKKISGTRYPGFSSRITAETKLLENFLKDDFRDMGKTRERNTYFSLTEATIRGEYYGERYFYAEITRGEGEQTVWFGVDTTGLSEVAYSKLMKMLDEYTYGFCIRYYQHEVQLEIEESEKAEQFTERSLNRLERDSAEYLSRLSDNARELIRLQEAIEANKLEKLVLEQKVIDNRAAQDSTEVSLADIRRVIEMLKKKKAKIR